MIRILFVDDDAFVRKALRRLLVTSDLGWHSAFAESGQQALEMLADESYDVIVSDIRMPGMDGAELLTRVASQYPKMTRIILSGQSEQDAFERATEHAQHYLPKPCSLTQLEEAIMAHHS